MPDIIPFTTPVSVQQVTELPIASEWAWDFENYDFARNSAGQMYKVYENEALKVWIWKLFKTWQEHEIIHTPRYGSDLWSLIGKGYSKGFTEAEARRIARETLETNLGSYIKSIGSIDVQLVRGTLKLTIPITTIYDEREEVVNIAI